MWTKVRKKTTFLNDIKLAAENRVNRSMFACDKFQNDKPFQFQPFGVEISINGQFFDRKKKQSKLIIFKNRLKITIFSYTFGTVSNLLGG